MIIIESLSEKFIGSNVSHPAFLAKSPPDDLPVLKKSTQEKNTFSSCSV